MKRRELLKSVAALATVLATRRIAHSEETVPATQAQQPEIPYWPGVVSGRDVFPTNAISWYKDNRMEG